MPKSKNKSKKYKLLKFSQKYFRETAKYSQIGEDLRKQIQLQQKSLNKYQEEKQMLVDQLESVRDELKNLQDKKLVEIKSLNNQILEKVNVS